MRDVLGDRKTILILLGPALLLYTLIDERRPPTTPVTPPATGLGF